jgi:hypothetical protein
VGQLFQLAFNMPRWVQWGGIIVAAIVALIVLRIMYIRRAEISAWLAQRSSAYKMGLAALAAVMLLGAGGVGYAGNHYMQHNNDFCVGCHVMGDAWGAFQGSEHKKLECHDCHRQSIFASARQLYFWVAEKPNDIPKHAKVPTRICAECHVQNDADSSWKRVVNTAGHRLHLKSDSASLKGKVECVTCHGQEVHEFKSVDKTADSQPALRPRTPDVLGAMAGRRRSTVPAVIALTGRAENIDGPTRNSCWRTAPRTVLRLSRDERPHEELLAAVGSWTQRLRHLSQSARRKSPGRMVCRQRLSQRSRRGQFHTGLAKHTTASCGECHKAHEWKAVGRECIDCHKTIFTKEPPRASSSDEAQAHDPSLLRPIAWHRATPRRRGRGAVHTARRRPPRSEARVVRHVALQPPVRSDAKAEPKLAAPPKDNPAFSHRIHRVLSCGGCHDQKNTHGTVTVRKADECAACHHSAERSVSCEGCHKKGGKLEKAIPRSVTMKTSADTPARTRTLPFAHRASGSRLQGVPHVRHSPWGDTRLSVVPQGAPRRRTHLRDVSCARQRPASARLA